MAVAFAASPAAAREQWTAARANAWYAAQPRLIGSNFVPASAINQLEMWQAATFDPVGIDRELGWAEGLGMTTMRVFLHDRLWEQDAPGFTGRIDAFLAIAARHHIRPLFVLFDSCWDPDPRLGPQHPPIPGVHNSGWLQSPGGRALADPREYPRLEAYTKGVIGAFRRDPRILGWDLWNEPDSPSANYRDQPRDKVALVAALLPKVFVWARAADPVQPLTSGIAWGDDWSPAAKHSAIEVTQLTESDVISFHDYDWPERFARRIAQLKPWGRPILCTEYMARGAGSTFDGDLPIAAREDVAMINWGFVDGRTQTRLPWDSWKRPYTADEPTVWFHEVLRADGTPYRAAEAAMIRAFAARPR